MSGPKIGMIGLGNMGGRIAVRIQDHGFDMVAVDPNPDQFERFAVPRRTTVSDLVADRDVVFLSLPNSKIIERVAYQEGLLEHSHDGQVVVDLSTADPTSSKNLHQAFGAKGVQFLDAGISGGARGAAAGTLSIMVGGDEATMSTLQNVFDAFSAHVYYMGAPGAGHTTKLLNNFLNGISLAATAEVVLGAYQAGLDLRMFLDVVNHSSGVNHATLDRFPRIIEGDYLEGGLTSELMIKDIDLYLTFVKGANLPTMVGPGCLEAFRAASLLGYGDQVSNHVIDALGDMVGGVRVQNYQRSGSQ